MLIGFRVRRHDTIQPMQSPLEALYEYYKTFSTLDLNAIVLHFSEPCMSISPQGVFSAGNRTELAHAFGPLVDGLKAKGYGRSEFVEAQVTTLGETARWCGAWLCVISWTSQNWSGFRSATLCIAPSMAGKSQRWCFRTDPAASSLTDSVKLGDREQSLQRVVASLRLGTSSLSQVA